MADHGRLAQVSLAGPARRAVAVVLAAFCGACAAVGDPVGFAVVAQDQYDFKTCPEIVVQRTAHTHRVKELNDLVAKAESAPGGVIVGYVAYRSELASARARLAAANRAALKNGCEPPKP